MGAILETTEKKVLVALNDSMSSKTIVDYIINLPLYPNELHICLLHIFRKSSASEELMGRKFTEEQLSLAELSYLLWATQGVKKAFIEKNISLRTVPSGGARQPFETYLMINNVEDIPKGVYRYLPLKHKLIFLFTDENMVDKLNTAAFGQSFVGNCAVCFICF